MKIHGLDHVSVIVQDAEQAKLFYQNVLGLQTMSRPELGFPGYWLALGREQTLHLMQLEDPYAEAIRPEHGGRDRHFAFKVDSLEEFIDRLERLKIAYRLSRSGRKALFFQDPDQNWIELVEV